MSRVIAALHGYLGGDRPLRAGAEHAAHEMLRALVDRGHSVDVVCTWQHFAPTREYVLDGVRVLPGHMTHQALWRHRYDVMVTHLDASGTALYAADRRMPTVVLLHNDHAETLRMCRRFRIYGRSRLLVSNSDWIRRRVLSTPGVITEGVGLVVAHPLVRVANYQVQAPGRDGFVTLVNVTESKGGVLLREVAARMPGVRFLAVLGAYGKQESYESSGNIEVMPNTDDMRSVYERTGVLMMGGLYESWGRVAIEAACSGIPTVSTPMPGPLEALGEAGTFVDGQDIDGWVRALHSLLSDGKRYAEAGEAAHLRAMELESIAYLQIQAFCDAVEMMVTARAA